MALPGNAQAAGQGFDLGSWASSRLRLPANLTQYTPSARDLLLAGPRAGMKIGSYLRAVPEVLDSAMGYRFGQSAISQSPDMAGSDVVAGGVDFARLGAENIAQGNRVAQNMATRLSLESVRGFGNIFSYSTSRWALSCIVMAIVLNRTLIYASPRRRLSFDWKFRLVLRALPILLFMLQVPGLLQSIQCQTSPDFSLLRWGNSSKFSELLFTQSGGFMHTISSKLLWNPSDKSSCLAVKMIPAVENNARSLVELPGSFARLWPLFKTLCLSTFVETLSCSLLGRPASFETGMTIFEHSLAFAEAEAAISHALGWGAFGGASSGTSRGVLDNGDNNLFGRSSIMRRVNTPPEFLLIAFISTMSHVTNHVLGILGLQARFRLISTGFWGLCFMGSIVLSILSFSTQGLDHQALLRFPTVCIIGFVPHIMILAGILLCTFIYGAALVLSAIALPVTENYGWNAPLRRLAAAHENMQAKASLSDLRIGMHMDFYQALLKCGYNVLTVASDAVYLQESTQVLVAPRTWLEEERLRELQASARARLQSRFAALAQGGQSHPDGLVEANNGVGQASQITSGFARERVTGKGRTIANPGLPRDGVGATERGRRWLTVVTFFLGIADLVMTWFVVLCLKLLRILGLNWSPYWAQRLAGQSKLNSRNASNTQVDRDRDLAFLTADKYDASILPKDANVDTEIEMRRRLQGNRLRWNHNDDETLENTLYSWWLIGGWWGSADNSGTYVPNQADEEDNTSVITESSDVNVQDWVSESDGPTTPTRSDQKFDDHLSPQNDTPLSTTELATLLNPKTPEQRAEAEALSAHLRSETIVTRSHFRQMVEWDRTKVVTSSIDTPPHLARALSSRKMTTEEETELLEHLILTRRAATAFTLTADGAEAWFDGARGLGAGGPQCVVCQSAPRSVIVWPCRCLCLCDECRVTLAMKSFQDCVCCRREVSSFSKIFVP